MAEAVLTISDRAKTFVKSVQDFMLLSLQALAGIFGRPVYFDETLEQMDYIGVRSLPLVASSALFVGLILNLQVASELAVFGAKIYLGRVSSASIVRELGPIITCVLVAGRVCSGMAAELGSMTVTYQIDAMRALGTDPVRKLVTPRLVAALIMLPTLTVIDDFLALFGGHLVSEYFAHVKASFYWRSAIDNLTMTDVVGGLIRPFVFGYCIAMVGCFYGLRTTGGAKGVRVSTTKAVVTSFVLIFFSDFLITKIIVTFFPPT